ncbi:gliding motility-associated C-terminal domain-containing protein, partial [Crocinitomicaceae bacterium]|nr:gliding motility-associated C-terminal domain-containing protein [Crocinitomicaceae bacterium]
TINTAAAGISTYTFTPDVGLCATVTTMDITIDPAVQSTFTQLGTYCEGDTPGALLGTSIEGITGSWSPTTISTAVVGTSAYAFTFDAGQCALGTTMDVEIIAPTIPTFTQIAPVCINGSASAFSTTSDNGITGTWSPAIINTAVAGTSTYTFTPDAGICATTTTMDITIDPAIQSTFTQLGTYCVGDTPGALLNTSLEGLTGTWSPVTINTATPGTSTYTFAIDAGQCALGTTMDVDITAPTTPTFTQIAPICINAVAAALPSISNNGVSGTWLPATINTTVAGTITYTFTPDVGLCATVTTMDVDIIALPFVDAGTDQVITCITNVGGAQVGSAPVAGNTYNWTPSGGLTTDDISNPIANPVGNTTYTVTVTDVFGCVSIGQVNVSLDNSPPTIGITNNTGSTELTCTLIDINLTATGGDTYSWDNGLGNTSNITVNSPGTYVVIGTGINGCESSSQIVISEDIDVDLIAILINDEICSGEDALINVTSSNATSFDWTVVQNTATGASAGTGLNTPAGLDIIQTLTTTGPGPGTIDYIISPVLGACTGSSQTITVNIIPPVNPVFAALGPYCLDETIGDNLNPISDNNITGVWSPSTISTSTEGTTTYSFVPQLGECAIATTMDIVVNALPTVSFSADNIEGCSPLNVNLTGGSLTGNNIWTLGNGDVLNGTSVNTSFLFPGCYDVTLFVEENGCSNTLTLDDYICVQSDPLASFSVSPQSFTDVNQLVSFTNNSQGAVDYIWSFGDGYTGQTFNPSHLYYETEAGIMITLTAISDFGCIDSTQVFIPFDEQEIFYVPNTFTPDGDNFNQTFTPIFYSGFDPYNFEMLIFNRWGEVIFETRDCTKGWDGSYGLSGSDSQDGVYTWKIIYKNPETDERKIVVGHVTLLR